MSNTAFASIYAQVPAPQRELLQAFRAEHPYQELIQGGESWRYITAGPQDAPTLLFLSGGFATADIWMHPILALEGDYRIIAPDAYPLQGTFDIDAICHMLRAILRAEGAQKATFVGLSLGGEVIQYLLQQHPESVEHVVLSHSGLLTPEKAAGRLRMARTLKLLPFFIAKKTLTAGSTGPFPEASAWRAFAQAYFQEMASHLTKEAMVRFYETQADMASRFAFDSHKLADWPGEMLLIASQDDQTTISNRDALLARYPRARTHAFEQGGHHPLLLFPQDYARVLSSFLDEAYGRVDRDAGPFVGW
ncbi:MAG: alpha/beta hydrolase [Chloroflexi bacterium]|nr:alpha/beta hydrolase [Chloroflexota bacterium]